MESCYGNGFTSCPMAGRNADLLAAGYANDTFQEVWKTLEKHLHTSEFVVGARPISMDDWQILHGNASSSKAYLWAEFELKLVPYTHLPGVFSVLGHATEDIARSGAARIIDMIGQDPRLKAHDTLTRTFIRPGVRRGELFNFARGRKPRHLRHQDFRNFIASKKFGSVIETDIEAKHARVSMASAMKSVGPVRVSLSNRLPWLERMLRKKHIHILQFMRYFEKARHISRIPWALGFEDHPHVVDSSVAPSAMRKPIAKILYHCIRQGMYRSAKKALSIAKKAQYRHAAIELNLICGGKKKRADISHFDSLQRSAMKQHFLHMCAKQSGSAPVVSFKRKPFALESFGTALNTSEKTRRQKAHEATVPEHDDHHEPVAAGDGDGALVPIDASSGSACLPSCLDLDVIPEPGHGASDSVFLRVVMANPSKQKDHSLKHWCRWALNSRGYTCVCSQNARYF